MALGAIAKRRDEQFRVDAAIHGIKLPDAAVESAPVHLTPEQIAMIENQRKATLARKRKELSGGI